MATTNADIVRILGDIASLLEVDEASGFRVRAYRNAADSIRFLDPPLTEMVEKGEPLNDLQDIGPAIAKKIEEIIQTGHLAYLDKLGAESGPGILELLRISGLGPKRVRLLRDTLNIRSPEELLAAAESGALAGVSGFGPKTVTTLLEKLRKKYGEDASAE